MEERKVIRIYSSAKTSNLPDFTAKKRVVAYARVSTSSDEQLNSVEAQKDYYEKYIKRHKDWYFAGLYADEGITGTSCLHREQFNAMIKDALSGEIDMIITKSISRFARNTVDTLQNIRKLKSEGIAIYFEKEDINTLDTKGEFMITLLSSMAQEEARSISENVTWGIRKRFSDGIYSVPYAQFLGYKKGKESILEIVPEEAKIIRYIYHLFLTGKSGNCISQMLTNQGIKTPSGKNRWDSTVVYSILKNEKYCGNALLQKTYIEDFLTKHKRKNTGQLPQYFIEHDHKAIINIDIWNTVQNLFKFHNKNYSSVSLYAKKLVCGVCGRWFYRTVRSGGYVTPVVYYRCRGKYKRDEKCSNIIIYEDEVSRLFQLCFIKQLAIYPVVFTDLEKCINTVIRNSSRKKAISKYFEELKNGSVFHVSEQILEITIKKASVFSNKTIQFEMINGNITLIPVRNWTPRRKERP